ncbi:DUF7064 domain-containing protein [Aeromicrobium alkaliterrae]|uniref:AttH domain-containing protein n=1 Tax=Aeromicrobium alkaliterrae TaxID=302168 RepID=A0ABP4WAP5_9ACTN
MHEPSPHDFLRHDISGTPHARESLVYHVHLPEEGVLSMYAWVYADGRAEAASAFFGPAAGDKAVFEESQAEVMAADADFTDWKVGTFHLTDGDPSTARLQLAGARLSVDYHFEAMHPAFLYSTGRADRSEALPKFAATDRYEQSGRVTGTIRIDDRTIEFDALGHRDHSWGRRDWLTMQHYKWAAIQAGESAVNLFYIEGEGRSWHLGYVFRDGELAAITHVDVAETYDDRWVQDVVDLEIDDAAGRRTSVTTTRFGRHEYPVGDGDYKLVDTAVHATIAGQAGVGYLDWGWPRDYLRHLRSDR